MYLVLLLLCVAAFLYFFSTLSFRRNKPLLEPYLGLCLLVMNESVVGYKCMIGNTSAIWQQATHTAYHLLAAQQMSHKKA